MLTQPQDTQNGLLRHQGAIVKQAAGVDKSRILVKRGERVIKRGERKIMRGSRGHDSESGLDTRREVGVSARRVQGTANNREESRVVTTHMQLRDAIIAGEFDPDVPISQVQLANRLGVSRTPLREALRMLQREGLIDSEPNRRVRVSPLSLGDLEDLYGMRLFVEALAVQLSVPLFTADDFAEMEGCLEEMDLMGERRQPEKWETPHKRYHDLLRSRAGPRLQRMGSELADYSYRYRRVYLSQPAAWSSASQDHTRIFEACQARDVALARNELARHLARTALSVIASIAPEHDPETVRSALRLVTHSAGDAQSDVSVVDRGHHVRSRAWNSSSRPS